MQYQDLQLDKVVKVRHRGVIAHGKIRRIGSQLSSSHGYRMLTLDVGGEAVYMAAHESELADHVQLEAVGA
jgi:hypothetical protein